MAQVKFVKGNITGTDSTYLRLETGNIEFDSNRRQILLDGVSYGESIPLLTDTRTSAAATITTSTSQIRQLYDGARVSIRLTLNTAANTSLNLTLSNGTTTGAIPIHVVSATSNIARMAANLGRTGMILDLVYNSTNNRWIQVGNTDKNNTYTNVSLGNGYAIQNNSSASSAITAALASYTLILQGRVSVRFNYDVPAGATLNINGKGATAIYYSGSAIEAGTLKSGDIATFVYNGTNYELVSKYTSGLTFDTVPTENSTNPVTSGGLYTVITENEETTAAALNDLNDRKVNTADLATVATSGSYNDLTDKPNIPVGPMIFKGSLGTGGTIVTLPAASSANTGYTYKVITNGTYASQAAKVGDTFVSDGSTWILIPSGDEPSGTVTSVGMTVPTGLSVSGSPVTTSGTLAVSYANGYSIPTTAKLAEWDNKQNALTFDSTPTYDSSNPVTSNGLYTEFMNVHEIIDGLVMNYAIVGKINSDNSVTFSARNTPISASNVVQMLETNTSWTVGLQVGWQIIRLYVSLLLDNGVVLIGMRGLVGGYPQVVIDGDTAQYSLLPTLSQLDTVPTSGSGKLLSSGSMYTALLGKQDTLVSGTNIKTINNESLLGSGNINLYKSGTTTQRPTTDLIVGMLYFDTTLGQPIWWNGTAWVDALGNTPGTKNYVYTLNN